MRPSIVGGGLTSSRLRRLLQVLADGLSVVGGLLVATYLRFELAPPATRLGDAVEFVPIAVGVQLALGAAFGLYQGRWVFGSFEEVLALVPSVVGATVAYGGLNSLVLEPRAVPQSVCLGGGVVTLVLMCGVRFLWRLLLDRRRRPLPEGSERVVVFGAGEGGQRITTSMMRSPDSPYLPVALLDDDPAKQRLHILGVPVVGRLHDLVAVAARRAATAVVVAIPSAGNEVIQEVNRLAEGAGLRVMVLPSVNELFGGPLGVGDIRPVTEADLLGRRAVDTDVDAIADYLTGKRVLVTGAGGSIGSELCRQVSRFAPASLVMLDRDESALHAVQLSIEGRALLEDPNLVVCDIRDRQRVEELFAAHRPEVVFHSAALKHLPLMEMHPSEAVKTNCVGTWNLLEVAAANVVDRFVNISTDKAADPCSVLGYTKRLAERVTSAVAERAEGTFLSVRFGNVLGSRGSVLTAFRAQIEAGGPVTVTHPEVTRYFMTVEEAVQLVVQAGAVGRDGEALVLDMGKPVRIADVARRLVEQAELPTQVVFTGLRPAEKLHEVLLGADEVDHRPHHPLISHVDVPPLAPEVLSRLSTDGSAPTLASQLRRLCELPPDVWAVPAPARQPKPSTPLTEDLASAAD
jgi:FlaA1/EpsC-like NDP-sugar epimerase